MLYNNYLKTKPLLDKLNDKKQVMVEQLIKLAEINSGSFNFNGVNKLITEIQKLFEPLGGEQEVIKLAPYELIDNNGKKYQKPIGNALRIRKRPEAKFKVFLGAHLDTVFAIDSNFQTVNWINDKILHGPGVADLKGGIIIMLHALSVLEASPWKDSIGWEVVLNPDEEIGSKSSDFLFAEAAKRVQVGMLYEPTFSNGDLAGNRSGSGNFTLVCYGKTAHAGREYHLGRNAIIAISKIAIAIDALNSHQEITVNVAQTNANFPLNMVPDLVTLSLNVRVKTPENIELVKQTLTEAIDKYSVDGIDCKLHGGFTRLPKNLTAGNTELFSVAKKIGENLGLNFNIRDTGGCCDGNNLANYRIPNIDTLGIVGDKIHTEEEFADVSSMIPQAKLSAGLLLSFAHAVNNNQDLTWLST